MSEYRVTDRRANTPGGLTTYQRTEKNPETGLTMSLGTRFQVMVRADTPEEAALLGASLLGLPASAVDVEDWYDPGTIVKVDQNLQKQMEAQGVGTITDIGL